jgi:cephalosporin-C deacetylase-like acetyl esterase
MNDMGMLRHRQGRSDDAREYWEKSLVMLKQLDSKKMIAEVESQLATLD